MSDDDRVSADDVAALGRVLVELSQPAPAGSPHDKRVAIDDAVEALNWTPERVRRTAIALSLVSPPGSVVLRSEDWSE